MWFYSLMARVCVGQAVYSASFSEDIPTNKGILTVGATDADSGFSAEIQYSLFGIGVEDFYMDANTGTVYIFFCRFSYDPRRAGCR